MGGSQPVPVRRLKSRLVREAFRGKVIVILALEGRSTARKVTPGVK
jgi:hypothetical protein